MNKFRIIKLFNTLVFSSLISSNFCVGSEALTYHLSKEKNKELCSMISIQFSKKILKKYSKELKDYVSESEENFCRPIENTNKVVMLYLYKDTNDSNLEITFKTIITIVDKEKDTIEQSAIYKSLKDRYIAELSIWIDTYTYANITPTYGFSIAINYLEKHGALYINHTSFSIYETYFKTFRILFEKNNSSSMFFHSLEKSSFTSEDLNNKILLTPYAPLEFKRVYTFHLFPEDGGTHEYWSVGLEEAQVYRYNDGKYEAVEKNFKPIFNLEIVEKNTKKGLRYKEIVLEAMVYEKPINNDSVERYIQIVKNLEKSKYSIEANFLKEKIRKVFPKRSFKASVTKLRNFKERSLRACQFVHYQWGQCYTLYSSVESLKKISRAYFRVETIRPKGELNPNGIPYSQTLKPSFTYINAKCKNNAVVGGLYSNKLDYFTKGGMGIDNTYELIAPLLCAVPTFSSFNNIEKYIHPSNPLIQKGFARLYRTFLKKSLKEKKPEFAGKYIIAQWGCDDGENECTTGGVIDASTGKATEFPFKYYAHNGSKEIIYKLDSSLIVFAGDFELGDGTEEKNQVRFYEVKEGEFLFLKASVYKK